MSRIGLLPVKIVKGVQVSLGKDNTISLKGPKGELKQEIDPKIKIEISDDEISLQRTEETKESKSKHGLYRALINNMMTGVSEGFKIVQEVVGVGYKASNNGQVLELSLGYSHAIHFVLPKEVSVATLTERGKNPTITLESADKQLLGQVAAKIRSLRKPEPYKGKGIKFQGEVLREKAGKAAAAK